DGRIVKAVHWNAAPEEWKRSMTDARDLTERLREALAGAKPLDELREIVEQSRENIEAPLPLRSRIPLINKVAAGYPAEFTDLDYPLNVADEYVECPDVTDPQAFAARVVGDSMAPTYREGEIVVFSPQLPTPSGTDCFIRLERDNETTFKRIYVEEDEGTIRLQPLNNAYPPRQVEREAITGMYAAAYVMRKV
ncbi:MAG: S24 family peptidase, partial [Planctomycetota bacterium]|nr:S24 family peptidase [Planctomycetota bacterium]